MAMQTRTTAAAALQLAEQTTAVSALQLAAPMLPGTASATAMVFVGFPFDTVKTRLQLGLHDNMRRCVQAARASGGLLSLYKGASVSLAILSCRMPLELGVFEWSVANIGGAAGSFAGGLLGATTASLATNPLTVLKVQRQMNSGGQAASTWTTAMEVWNARGFRGFYRGLLASMSVTVPFSTLYFGIYGHLRDTLPQSPLYTTLSGGSASFLTWLVVHPLDTLRTRTQASASRAGAVDSWLSHLRRAVKVDGITSLWRGFTPVALRALPSQGTAMLAYETTKSLLRDAA